MPKTIYNRAQIIRKIAKTTDITQDKAKAIIGELEKQIFELSVARSKVQIKEFGAFRVYKRKSTTIKQIGTKKNRLVIPQKTIRFIATDKFKDRFKNKTATGQTKTEIEDTPPAIDSKNRIVFGPLSYFDKSARDDLPRF